MGGLNYGNFQERPVSPDGDTLENQPIPHPGRRRAAGCRAMPHTFRISPQWGRPVGLMPHTFRACPLWGRPFGLPSH